MVSGTIEAMGTMLAGQTVEAFATSVMHADLLSLGLNCATGPEFMTDHIRSLAELTENARVLHTERRAAERRRHLSRNAREHSATTLERFVDHGWINLVGGCCGTTPAHIRALAQMVEGKRPRVPAKHHRTLVFGHRLCRSQRRPAPVDRRRAHQRSRLAQVQAPDHRRKIRRSRRDRPRSRSKAARRSAT